MKIDYDKEVDALYIHFQEGTYDISKEVAEGIMLDFDAEGKLIGIEILDVSEKMPNKKFSDGEISLS